MRRRPIRAIERAGREAGYTGCDRNNSLVFRSRTVPHHGPPCGTNNTSKLAGRQRYGTSRAPNQSGVTYMAEQVHPLPAAGAPDNRSLSDVVQGVLPDVRNIVRAEIRLDHSELLEKARGGGRTAAILVSAAVVGLLSAACLIATCIALMTLVLPFWASVLIVGCVLGLVAAGLYAAGRTRLDVFEPALRKREA